MHRFTKLNYHIGPDTQIALVRWGMRPAHVVYSYVACPALRAQRITAAWMLHVCLWDRVERCSTGKAT